MIDNHKDVTYSEEGQPMPIRFQPFGLRGDGELVSLSAPFMCTDFFVEAVISSYTGKPKSIYGFKWNGEEFYGEGAHILIHNVSEDAINLAVWYIRGLEKNAGFDYRTRVDQDIPNLLRVSYNWTLSPLLIHTFCFLFRSAIRAGEYGWSGVSDIQKFLRDDSIKTDKQTVLWKSYDVNEVVGKLLDKWAEVDISNLEKGTLSNEKVGTQHNYSGIKTLVMAYNGEAITQSEATKLALSAIK